MTNDAMQGFDNERTDVALESDERIHTISTTSRRDDERQLIATALLGGGDGQEKGKKKASDGRHDGRNPDGFNGPPE